MRQESGNKKTSERVQREIKERVQREIEVEREEIGIAREEGDKKYSE